MKKVGVKISAAIVAVIVAFFSLVYPTARVGAVKNTNVEYNIYNGNGDYQSSYTLPKVAMLSESMQRGSIGIDNREVDFSKNGVCKLVAKQGGESFCSTGFVIDSHTIATAAHCVYDVEEADSTKVSSKTEIEHILFFNGNEQVVKRLSSENVTGVHVPNNFWRSNQPLYGGVSDYALITVNIDLSNYLVFNLGFPMDNIKDYNLEVYTTGFPGRVNEEIVNNTIIGGPYAKHAAYTSVGTIIEMNSTKIVNDIYISGGNSGGPVYISSTYDGKIYYTVIGIVNGAHPDGNSTYRITTDVLHFFKNNPNL